MNRDQLAERLLATFVSELEEQVKVMNAELLALEGVPTDPQRLKALFRVAHTLKGAAHASNQPLIQSVCHTLETLLAQARDGKAVLGPGDFRMLFSAADALADARERLSMRQGLAGSPLSALQDRLMSTEPAREAPLPVAPPLSAAAAVDSRDPVVRIEADKLDALLAETGQLLVASSTVADRAEGLQTLQGIVRRLTTEWGRTSRQLRVALERSGAAPSLLQVVHGVDEQIQRIGHDASRLAESAREDSRILSQVTAGIADGVRRLRLRPVVEACDSLARVVRDLADATSKEVDLRIEADGVEADRAVLDGLRDALVQLVRNAVDHGIESPADRARLGKSRRGLIRVAATLDGGRLMVIVEDDGAGLDVATIRAQLARQGRPIPDDDQHVAAGLFAGGLSTRSEVTTISGRGVGLDIVRAAVERIRGTVDVAWREGRGTTFTIECPPTLATVTAVLAAVGSQTLAIPTSHIERMLRVRPDEVKQAEGRDVILMSAGPPVPLVSLARLLPPLSERRPPGPIAVIVLRAGERRVAVAVDALVAEQEIVLRPVWRSKQAIPHVSGAAILGSGRVALVLDPVATIASGLSTEPASTPTLGVERKGRSAKRRILVVDDSITTRTLEQSILEAAGYEVETAVDGAAAWTALQERGSDLVVADVEMPRMDGIALCEAVRRSTRFRQLPLILVTALETPVDRARGLDAGADAYLAKSSFDQQRLLDTISRLLGEPTP